MNSKRRIIALYSLVLFSVFVANAFVTPVAAVGLEDTPAKSRAFLDTLSKSEQAWLAEHPVIRVATDPGWPPVEFTNERGEPSGMSLDYMRLVEERLGVKFEMVRNQSWQEAYARLKRWDIDMTTCVAVTPERNQFWAFTKPYLNIPIVIATQSEVTYIGEMRELEGKKVAVVSGYAVEDWIRTDFPGIHIVRVKSALDGLESLQRGDVFAYIDNLLIIGHYQAKMEVSNIKIAGQTPYANSQCMAVRKDWAPLARIIQKALDSISERERDDIYRKWLPIRYEHGYDYRLLFLAFGVFAAVVLAMVLRNRRLVKKIEDRKQAEAALRESEERFRRLVELAPLPLCLVSSSGEVSFSNKRFVRVFGYTVDDVPTLAGWWERAYPDPEYRDWVITTWEAAVNRAAADNRDIDPGEYRVTCKNGEVRIVEISGITLGDEFLATFIDLTEREKAEDALRESEAKVRNKLHAILEPEGDIGALSLSDIIDYQAVQNMMEDFYQLTKITGAVLDKSGKVLVAVGWQDICTKFHRIHPETAKNCHESDVTLAEGVPAGGVRAYRCKNNLWDAVTPINVGGRHLGNIYMGQFFYADDVPDYEVFRRQARQYGFDEAEYLAALDKIPRWNRETVDASMAFYAKLAEMISSLSYSKVELSRALHQKDMTLLKLRESEERYRSILNASPDDITIADMEGHILMISPVALKMFGCEREEDIMGRPITEFVVQEDRDRALSNLALRLQGVVLEPIEYTALRSDGSTFSAEVNAEYIRDSDGQPTSIVVVLRDITERKRAEEEIRQFNMVLEERVQKRTAELEVANKELEAFSYSVSHDLRTPLRAIDGFSQAVIDDYGNLLDEQGQDHLRRVRAATMRMADLIDDLLKLSRVSRDGMKRQEVFLSKLANIIISNLQYTEPEREVEVSIEPDIIVQGDEHLLRVMLENLLGNAWKFSRKQPKARIEFGSAILEGERVNYVRDNGSGFDMAYASKLFGAFQRLHTAEEFPGTGIGLATVRRVINRHGGRIWAEAEEGKGATFYFTL